MASIMKGLAIIGNMTLVIEANSTMTLVKKDEVVRTTTRRATIT